MLARAADSFCRLSLRPALIAALLLAGCIKARDVEEPSASAACKSPSHHVDAASDTDCNTCCVSKKTTRGTVYGTGSCHCYNGHTSLVAPTLRFTTEVHATGPSLPPRFKLSGGGDAIMFIVMGPFTDQASLRAYNANRNASLAKILWSIKAVDTTTTARSLPVIEYGVMPKEFKELQGPPPALEAGQLYIARVAGDEQRIGAASALVQECCFELRPTEISEIPCK